MVTVPGGAELVYRTAGVNRVTAADRKTGSRSASRDRCGGGELTHRNTHLLMRLVDWWISLGGPLGAFGCL